MIVVLQYIYAFALFGGVLLGLWKAFVWFVRFALHVRDVSRRFDGGPR